MSTPAKPAPTSARPVPKVQAGINWGGGAFVFITCLAVFAPDIYARIPDVPGLEAALGTFIGSVTASAAAYIKRG